MESANILLAGLWTFAIIALVGGVLGRVDGFFILMLFLVAVGVSLVVVAMERSRTTAGAASTS